MKITDYSIVFAIIFLAFYLTYHFENQASESTDFTAMELNKIMDEIVVDAMQEGYEGVDEKLVPVLNRDALIQGFSRECSLILEEHYVEQYIPAFVKKIIYIQNKGYYVYEEGRWSQKIIFPSEQHEDKVNMIIRSLTRAVNSGLDKGIYRIQIPICSGEEYSQTISEYSFLVLCEDLALHVNGNEYRRYFLSGAALKKNTET